MKDEVLIRSIIPAQPDWALAVACCDERHVTGFSFEPIIAWRIEVTSGQYAASAKRPDHERWVMTSVWPITVMGDDHNIAPQPAIRRPDGSFTIPLMQDFENEAEALKHYSEIMQPSKT
jgi:hypothetical protein